MTSRFFPLSTASAVLTNDRPLKHRWLQRSGRDHAFRIDSPPSSIPYFSPFLRVLPVVLCCRLFLQRPLASKGHKGNTYSSFIFASFGSTIFYFTIWIFQYNFLMILKFTISANWIFWLFGNIFFTPLIWRDNTGSGTRRCRTRM